jgi:DNA repair protein SbcD/Mre11
MTDGTLRIAHIADTHLGFSALTRLCPDSGRNQRAVDVEHAFAAAIDHIIATGDIDLVLHAGDVFHHSRPPMQTLIFFVRQMRRLEAAGIPTIVIGGNHDTPRLRNAGSVLDLCAIACHTIHFATGYDWERIPLEIGGRRVVVTAVPHGAFTNEQPPNALFADDDALNLLVAHGSYNLALTNDRRGGADEIEEALLDTRYDYVALGHWHLHERKGRNVFYSGSTERIGLSDLATTPGYARVVLNGADEPEVSHVPLPAREHLKLAAVDGSELSADAIVGEVVRRLERETAATRAEAIVLCAVRDTALGIDREVIRQLRGLDIVRSCWAFVPDVRAVRAPGVQTEESSPIGQLLDEFSDFVAGRAQSGLYEPAFAATFRETGRKLLEEELRGDEPTPESVPTDEPELALTGATA